LSGSFDGEYGGSARTRKLVVAAQAQIESKVESG
jgi:hypothetical protein